MIYLLDKTDECKELKSIQKRKYEHEKAQNLLAYAVFYETGVHYDESMVQYENYGKPNIRKLIPIEYNYSHCNGLILCIISDKPVGIDVEKIRRFQLNTLKRVCNDSEYEDIINHNFPERRFFEYWTLKESYVKAVGSSIYKKVSYANFRIISEDNIISNKSDYQFYLRYWNNEYVIAICISNK